MGTCWDAFQLDCVCPAPPVVFLPIKRHRGEPGHTGQTHEPHKPNPLKTNPPTDQTTPKPRQSTPALIAVVAACLVVNLRILLIWLLGRGGREALLVDVASSVLQDAVVIAIFGPKIRILDVSAVYLERILCVSSAARTKRPRYMYRDVS